MKKSYFSFIGAMLILFSLQAEAVSAFLPLFTTQEEGSTRVERFISSLFQTGNKTGASLVGEVSLLSFSTTTDTVPNSMTIQTKQRSQVVAISSETKVRKFGIPTSMEDVRVGDKVSIVSSISKTESPRLRARVISILSQGPEPKAKPLPELEIASSTEVKSASTTEDGAQKEVAVDVEKPEKDSVKDEKTEEKILLKTDVTKKVLR